MRFDASLLPTDVPEDVYPPLEDTLLLIDAVEVRPEWKTALEIGCGSGLVSMHLAKGGLEVTAVDVNPAAVNFTLRQAERNGLGLQAHVSDLFSAVRGRFNLIVFNPPYLPSDVSDNRLTESERRALVGGAHGIEVAERFAEGVAGHLDAGGAAYLVVPGIHVKRLVEREDDCVWSLAKEADLNGEMLAVVKAVPKS